MGNSSGWSAGLLVSGDGRNLVSHAGTAALRMLADQVGLTRYLSKVLAQPRLLVHDRGRVLTDLAVSIADGAEIISGIDTLGESEELYGSVASVSTTWRALGEIAATGDVGRRRIARAVAKTRAHVWDLIAGRHGGLPPIRVADREVAGMVGIRIDATLITAHSDKELASPNWKKGFGFQCAMRRSGVSPAQPGGTWKEVPGPDDLPDPETVTGPEHVRKPAAVPRRCGRCVGWPA